MMHVTACGVRWWSTESDSVSPDHGVPDNVMSIISFIRHVRKLFPTSVDQPGPVLVHCSAGIGRSGTFITLDMMMQQMKDKSTLGVCRCVRYLRTQRMKMVQTRVCMYTSIKIIS